MIMMMIRMMMMMIRMNRMITVTPFITIEPCTMQNRRDTSFICWQGALHHKKYTTNTHLAKVTGNKNQDNEND